MAGMEKFKITSVVWDSDKDPSGFQKWMNNISSMVRATKNGPPLEDFLDGKLGRHKMKFATIPSFITEDPDFARTIEEASGTPAARREGEDGESQNSNSQPSMDLRLSYVTTPYHELPEESKELDVLLYNIIIMNVKGQKATLLTCVAFPSYVQGMCVLAKHVDISHTQQKTAAFRDMENLEFRGDVQKYQIEAMKKVNAIFDAKCSIMDYVLMQIMRSFDGKSKIIQHKIADDINNHKIDDKLNVYDLIQRYCSDMASAGEGTQKVINYVDKGKCGNCGIRGHTEAKCRRKNKEKVECYKCGKRGHYAYECSKEEDEEDSGDSVSSTSDSEEETKKKKKQDRKKKGSKEKLSSDALSALLARIETGNY
jgi:hypothetical protein